MANLTWKNNFMWAGDEKLIFNEINSGLNKVIIQEVDLKFMLPYASRGRG